ncbi:DUF3093 domain-containing protein [Marisediminicola sp. LYQ134]|uniref:DUF3093 domain-containing protein n=1 Tax=Marisediminicola sp. LYQ134 TaxID=3391061 RepID=UPI003982FAA4
MEHYRERMWPSPWIFISLGLVVPASLLVFLPISILTGIVTAIVLYGATVGSLVATSPVITVRDGRLTAGKATLPLEYVGEATAFEGAEATLERGRRLDARAWLVIRGWINPVVKIVVTDETDPTPYWLVSSRRPDDLIAALGSAGARTN